MNILFIECALDGTVGGSHACLYNLVKSLDRGKYKILVRFYQDNVYVEKFKRIGVTVQLINRKPFICNNSLIRKMCNWYRLVFKHRIELKNIFINNRVDLVVINNTIYACNDIVTVCNKLRIPVIVYERGYTQYLTSDIQLSKKINASIAVSYFVKKNMEKQNYSKNTLVFYDGIDINEQKKYLKTKSCIDIKISIGIPNDSIVIGIIGNIREWKGQEYFIKAFMCLGEKYSNLYGLVIGSAGTEDAEYIDYLKSISSSTKFDNRLIYLGYREDVPDLLKIMDVLVHASIKPEPFGMVILEAMYNKVPVIATNFGGPVEILDNGSCGILVPPKNEIAITNGVEKYLSNPLFREEIINRAYKSIVDKFDLRRTVSLVDDLFQDVASRRNRTARQGTDMNKSLIQALEYHRQDIIENWYDTQFNEGIVSKYGIRGLESNDRSWVRPSILNPLLNLVIEYLRTNEERYLVVYQDERLRYAPHQATPEERGEFFQLILPADEAALLNAVEDGERTTLEKALSKLHAPLLAKPLEGTAPVLLLTLGDCLMNEIRVFLSHRARQMGIPLDMRILYFSAAINRGLSIDEVLDYLNKNKVDFIAMSFLSFEGIPAYSALLHLADKLSNKKLEEQVANVMTIVREFIESLRKHTSVPFLIHNAGGLPLTGARRHIPFIPAISRGRKKAFTLLNQALHDLVVGLPKCTLLSETDVIAREGYRASSKLLIPKRVIGKGYFHTSIFGSLMSEQYLPVLKAYQMLRKTKLLLVDFDNTLWKGVMADDSVEHYIERQQLLRRLKDAGILLVALSKNSPENIRWDEMVLKSADFVSLKINWNLKAQSVQEIATELNLGMDSFVLLDDNPVECELIRQVYPKVVCLDSLAEETWAMLELLFLFPNTQNTEESLARTEIYRAQVARQNCIANELDYPAMMRSLGLHVNFGKANTRDLDRLTELINRTNQFNTTTIRYSKTDLGKYIRDNDVRIYVADLEDKFGKLGLVTAAIVKRQGEERVLELFIMSCRAMSFGLENFMLRRIVEVEITGAKKIIGRYVPSDRNLPAASFFKNNRFEPVTETDWHLTSIDAMPLAPEWFTVSERP